MAQVYTLREIQCIVSRSRAGSLYKGKRVHCSINEDPFYKLSRGEWHTLPRLRKHGQVPYRTTEQYLKHVDRLISKHGPDAKFESFEMYDEEHGFEDKPIEEGGVNDDSQIKGVGKGLSFDDTCSHEQPTDRKRGGVGHSNPPLSKPRMSGGSYVNGVAGSDTGNALPASLGSASYSRAGQNPGEITTGPSHDGGCQKTSTMNTLGKQIGVGSRLDATGKDAYRPNAIDSNSLKTLPKMEANPVTNLGNLDAPGSEWGMYPHPTYSTSFSAYVKSPKFKLPPMFGSIAAASPRALPWDGGGIENEKIEGGDFSTENSFGDGNPGGYVDEAFAKLHSKKLKAQARSVQSRMEMIFRMNEVGVGQEDTPRLNPVALIKEILSKSMRMSKTHKEERGSGLKMIMVDISPSCAAIRDACYAAAIAIADSDSDVIVFTHFNGYMEGSYGKIIGRRHSEVPVIREDASLSDFELFLSSGKLAGAIAFGDSDAAKLYGLIARYAPLVWMTPNCVEDSKYDIKQWASGEYCFEKASLYIVPDVRDGYSAIKGMEAVLKAKKV